MQERTGRLRPGFWAALAVALGYFVDLYDLVVFAVVRVPSLGPKGIGLPALDPTIPEGGFAYFSYMLGLLTGSERGDVTTVGSLLLNLQLIGMVVGGAIWGMLGDRRGRMLVLFASISLYSVCTIANAFVTTVPAYAALRFLVGFGLSGELGTGVTLVLESMDSRRRGLGPVVVATAGMLGPVAACVVALRWNWQFAYLLGGALGLALLALRVRVVESEMFRRASQETQERGRLITILRAPGALRRLVALVAIGSPTWLVAGLILVFAPELAIALECPEPVRAPVAIMWGYLGASFGDVFGGLLSQRLRSRRPVIAGAILLLAVSLSGLLTLGGKGAAWFYVATGFVGFSAGYWALFVTMAGETFGTNIRATAATIASNLVRGSAVLMVIAWDLLTPGSGAIGAAAIVGGVVMLFGLVGVAAIPEPFGNELEWHERRDGQRPLAARRSSE